jgi:hypothetical protein
MPRNVALAAATYTHDSTHIADSHCYAAQITRSTLHHSSPSNNCDDLCAAGGVAVGDLPLPNPAPDWIADKCWGELCRASDLGAAWQGLAAHVAGAATLQFLCIALS